MYNPAFSRVLLLLLLLIINYYRPFIVNCLVLFLSGLLLFFFFTSIFLKFFSFRSTNLVCFILYFNNFFIGFFVSLYIDRHCEQIVFYFVIYMDTVCLNRFFFLKLCYGNRGEASRFNNEFNILHTNRAIA